MSFDGQSSYSFARIHDLPDSKQNADDWQRGFSLWRFIQRRDSHSQEQQTMNDGDQLFLQEWISLQQDDYRKFKRGQPSFLYQQGFDVLARMGFEFGGATENDQKNERQRNENEKENSRSLSFQDITSPLKGDKGMKSPCIHQKDRSMDTSSVHADETLSPAPLGDRVARLRQSASPNQSAAQLHLPKGVSLFPIPSAQCDTRDGVVHGGFAPGGSATVESDDDNAKKSGFRHEDDDTNAAIEVSKTHKSRRRTKSGIGQRLKKKRMIMHPSFAITDDYEIPSKKTKPTAPPKVKVQPKVRASPKVRELPEPTSVSVEPKGSAMNWDQWFDRLRQFHDATGHVNIPANHHPSEQKRLYDWLRSQRKRKALTDEQKRKLVGLGVTFPTT